MPIDLFLNVAVGGVLTGLVYGLMALGLSVIFGVVRVVNFAHGEMMAIAMYVALMVFGLFGINPLLMILPCAALLFAIGYVLQGALINRFITRPEHSQFLLMVGIAIIITNVQLMAFGPDARSVLTPLAFESYQIGHLIVDADKLYGAIAAVVVALALIAFFRWSRVGTAIRACADNYIGAQVIGLNIKQLYALTFGLGCACVGAAGAILMLSADVTPQFGPIATLQAFVIVITGGMGSMVGALLGGVLIGLTAAMAGLLFMPSLKAMFVYGILVLVLLFRPQGILGRKPS